MYTPQDLERRFVEAIRRLGTEDPTKPIDIVDRETTEVIETGEGDDENVSLSKEKELPKPATINLFQHPDAHPLILDLALLRKYGPEWMIWEPEVLEMKIPQDFRTTSVSDLTMEKIQAVKTLHFVDTFWERWEVFVWCTMPLNDIFPDFGVLQVPTAAQCMVAVYTASKIRDDITWSDEIKDFLEVVFRHDGIFCPVDPVGFIEIDAPSVIDCHDIRKRWDEVRITGKAPTRFTIEDEQLRRMLTVHEYLMENKQRFIDQTRLLDNV